MRHEFHVKNHSLVCMLHNKIHHVHALVLICIKSPVDKLHNRCARIYDIKKIALDSFFRKIAHTFDCARHTKSAFKRAAAAHLVIYNLARRIFVVLKRTRNLVQIFYKRTWRICYNISIFSKCYALHIRKRSFILDCMKKSGSCKLTFVTNNNIEPRIFFKKFARIKRRFNSSPNNNRIRHF